MALNSDYDDYIYFNETESNEFEHHTEKTALHFAAAFTTLVFCVSLPGNSFLLWVLRREQAWKTTSDILLMQLIVSNLCFTVTLPFLACNELHGWIFGEWACGVGTGIYHLGLTTSVVILTAMSFHCYITAVQTSCLSTQASSKFGVLVASIVIWIVCAAASIKVSVSSRVRQFRDMEVCIYFPETITMLLFDLYMELSLSFFIPFLIVTFCYIHVWITMKQGRINSHQRPSKVIFGISVGTFLCLAPYNILIFIQSLLILGICRYTHELLFALQYAWLVFYPLTHFCCCLSPLFHIIGSQRFRRYLPLLCNTLSQSKNGSNNGSSMAFIPLQNASEM